MAFEHDSRQPEQFQEDWEGQFSVFSWMAYVTAIPHVIYLVTTRKENGLPNACLQGWSCFSGEGEHYYAIMSGVMKHTHTYRNIKRSGEFCINFLAAQYIAQCKQSIFSNGDDVDEITAAGLSAEMAHTIDVPRIRQSFLKLECQYEWEKPLLPNSNNVVLCGKVRHVAASDSFVHSSVHERFGDESFVMHLMAMKNPESGERLRGGIGRIEVTREMEL